jgi:hypothetical protein
MTCSLKGLRMNATSASNTTMLMPRRVSSCHMKDLVNCQTPTVHISMCPPTNRLSTKSRRECCSMLAQKRVCYGAICTLRATCGCKCAGMFVRYMCTYHEHCQMAVDLTIVPPPNLEFSRTVVSTVNMGRRDREHVFLIHTEVSLDEFAFQDIAHCI